MSPVVVNPERRRWSKRQLLHVWHAHHGLCLVCGVKIRGGERWEAHHVEELADGGKDELQNMAPVHLKCHKRQTASSKAVRAKVERVAAKHLGIKQTRSRPLPGARNSMWKHTMSNGWVRRP